MNNVEPRAGVEDHPTETAEEFLAKLSPRDDLWRDEPTRWIFRGQADAEWKLVARAVRDMSVFEEHGVAVASVRPGYVPSVDSYDRKGRIERMLERFREGLDRSGMIIPSLSPTVMSRESFITNNAEPYPSAYPLMALAQHHGLPTLFLDWSRRAWVAAYFASVGAVLDRTGVAATHLAVWGFERGNLMRPAEMPYFYEAPGGTNPNLAAQSGLFTILPTEDDVSLEEHLVRTKRITGGVPRLRRVTLPVGEAPKTLRLLSYEGIDGAQMFPGADGVVRAMRESARWDKPRR